MPRDSRAVTTPRVVYVPRFAYPLLKLLWRDRVIYATFYRRRVRVGLREASVRHHNTLHDPRAAADG